MRKRCNMIMCWKTETLLLKTGIYSHVVIYDQTAQREELQRFWAVNQMKICAEFFQTPLNDEAVTKYGSKIHLYCRQTVAYVKQWACKSLQYFAVLWKFQRTVDLGVYLIYQNRKEYMMRDLYKKHPHNKKWKTSFTSVPLSNLLIYFKNFLPYR